MTVSKIPRFGFSLDAAVRTASVAQRQLELDQIKAVGGQMVRIGCSPGQYTTVDPIVDDALARGLSVLICLYAITTPIAVDTFGHDTAVHYGAKVNYYEIANEPDIHSWTADGYADFVSGTSDSVKSGNPDAKVIAGALWKGGGLGSATDPQHFVTSLCTRAAGKFDYVSAHLYDNPLARASWNIWDWVLFWGGSGYCDNGANGGNCRQIMDANGAANVPIISTEGGGALPTYTEAQKATWIGSGIDQVAAGKIQMYMVYEMRRHSTTLIYSLLDGSDVPVDGYYAYQNGTTKYRFKGAVI